MNENNERRPSLEEILFGDQENNTDDVSLESALAARQMPAKKTVKVEAYDTELGWTEDYITVEVEAPQTQGTLASAVEQYGETFPVNVIVTWMGWDNKEHRITSITLPGTQSCRVIMDGKETTFNSLEAVSVKVLPAKATITAEDIEEWTAGNDYY